jgi:hypothetical protein
MVIPVTHHDLHAGTHFWVYFVLSHENLIKKIVWMRAAVSMAYRRLEWARSV